MDSNGGEVFNWQGETFIHPNHMLVWRKSSLSAERKPNCLSARGAQAHPNFQVRLVARI